MKRVTNACIENVAHFWSSSKVDQILFFSVYVQSFLIGIRGFGNCRTSRGIFLNEKWDECFREERWWRFFAMFYVHDLFI